MTIFSGKNIEGSTEARGGYTEILATSSTHALENMFSGVLDASQVTPDGDGRRVLTAGTILSKNSDNKYEEFTAAAQASETNVLNITGATSGTFTLSFEDDDGDVQETGDIAYNATAAQVETALEGLSNIGAGNVTVAGAGDLPTNALTITFAGDLANQNIDNLITIDATNLVGASDPKVTQGVQGDSVQAIAGILALDVEFVDGSEGSDTPAPYIHRDATFRASRIKNYDTHAAALATALPTCKFV